jgi:hypothetical protein
MSNIILFTPKFGSQTVLIDAEDLFKLEGYGWTLWSSVRHIGIYVVGYLKGGKNKSIRLHRLIMDAQPGQIVDHINGNPLDNRKCNLRLVTSLENNQNARKRKDGVTSVYKGVHYAKTCNKWKAQTSVKGKKLCLGTFRTELEAARAYDAALDLLGIVGPRNLIKSAS